MDAVIKIKIPKLTLQDALSAFVFISYFCSEVLRSVEARLIGSGYFDIMYNAVFFTAIFFLLLTSKRKRFAIPVICYLVVAFLFAITLLVHPEYIDWYFESTYGIQIQFFHAVGGIWAFLVVYMISDREKLLKYLRISAWILFIFLSFRFASAQVRGYWVSYGADYSRLERDYNLGFGYSMIFPVLFFATEAYLNRKKMYYIPFIVGTLLILLGGSRGAIIWVAVIFLFMLPYRWNAMSKNEKRRAFLLIVILVPIVCFIYWYYDLIMERLIAFLSTQGIPSRTLTSMLTGDFFEANGRDEIYKIVIERIKEGGILGNGVFGERVVVGQKYRWGYAHNLFLEIYAAFGYLGGTIFSLVLIVNILKTAFNCRNTTDQMVFITFLTSSMKLMLSDSFWFNSSFWGLLAIMIMWRERKSLLSEKIQ